MYTFSYPFVSYNPVNLGEERAISPKSPSGEMSLDLLVHSPAFHHADSIVRYSVWPVRSSGEMPSPYSIGDEGQIDLS